MTDEKSHTSFADVALPMPVDRLFTYKVPDELARTLSPGCRVMVPVGRRKVTGYVISLHSDDEGKFRIKDILAQVDDQPLVTEDLMRLARWISDYYIHSLGEVLRAMLPASIKGKGRKSAEDQKEGEFPREAHRPVLGKDQQAAFDAVMAAFHGGRGENFLIYGVTGSGKTEVYLRVIEEVLAAGRTALVLVPEIALIPQSTARFRRRFGSSVAVLHSRLTGPQRSSIWKKAAAGDISVVIGPRSAVFVPLKDLGMIIVDEEQDPSFKQEEKPHYSAVEVAKFRGRNEKTVVVFGSATPSLEIYDSALKNETTSFSISSRPAQSSLPPVEIVDMRGRAELISDELLQALEGCVGKGEQAIVLLNRRGHANYIQCRKCGWIDRCPNCSISLTYHSSGHRLICHYCGYLSSLPDRCPRCGDFNIIQKGIGTQRVEMELGNLVPSARILRMDLDTTAGKRSHLEILEKFAKGEAQILLGTRMVAKGHHYPGVTLVGVIAADAGLNFPDFRAAERTFQLLSQAAGRTGRGRKKGNVIIQALAPEHYLYDYLKTHDFDGFARNELLLRKEFRYPPVSRLILFTLSSDSPGPASAAASRARDAVVSAGIVDESDILGPVPAVVGRLRRKFRFQVLVKGTGENAAKKAIVDIFRKELDGKREVDLQWNIDPGNLF
ncbi:MAG: primosomal protein N' [Candidatus Krumholzibacteriota bacterium]|nr:primosomal protein N' [Candidatus Krumholzibacteriota bacterium]